VEEFRECNHTLSMVADRFPLPVDRFPRIAFLGGTGKSGYILQIVEMGFDFLGGKVVLRASRAN
jgi:hypothetical protein